MPIPSLPTTPPPTPDQVAAFVQQVGESVVNTVESSSQAAESAMDAGVQAAITQIQQIAGTARRDVEQAAQQARQDILSMMQQVAQLLGQLPGLALGTVNADPFFEPAGAIVLIVKAVNEGKPRIKIETHEPTVIATFQSLAANSEDEFKRKLLAKLYHDIPVLDPSSPNRPANLTGMEWAAIIVALAALVLAAGTAIFVVLLGIAIIYAISRNYNVEGVKVSYTSTGPTIEFTLKKS